MNQNQNQTIFTRSEIAERIEADATRSAEIEARVAAGETLSKSETSERYQLEYALERRLQRVLEDAGLTQLDALDLELRAASAFGADPVHIHWGFYRLPTSASLWERRPAVEVLTGSRMRGHVMLALLPEDHGIEWLASPVEGQTTPWGFELHGDEAVFLAAQLDRHYAPELVAIREREKPENDERFEASRAAVAGLPEIDRYRAGARSNSEWWVRNGDTELGLLPVLGLDLADAVVREQLVAAACAHLEGLATSHLENPGDEPELGSLERDVLALELPHTRRARAALDASREAAAAAQRAQAAISRSIAQGVLARLSLGAIRHVDPAGITALTPRELVELACAVKRAYPKASLAGGFCYLVGKPEGFDEFWGRFRDANDPFVPRLESWADHCAVGDSEEWSGGFTFFTGLSLDHLTTVLTEGFRAIVEMELAPRSATDTDPRELAIAFARTAHDEILSCISTDVEADCEILADGARAPRERAEAAMRLAGFLARDVEGGPAGEDAPFLTSELHLGILRSLPVSLRLGLLRPAGAHQSIWRRMHAAAFSERTAK